VDLKGPLRSRKGRAVETVYTAERRGRKERERRDGRVNVERGDGEEREWVDFASPCKNF